MIYINTMDRTQDEVALKYLRDCMDDYETREMARDGLLIPHPATLPCKGWEPSSGGSQRVV